MPHALCPAARSPLLCPLLQDLRCVMYRPLCPLPPSPLLRLTLKVTGLGSWLPEFEPGALPLLEDLELDCPDLQAALPLRWGVPAPREHSPRQMLPSLRRLSLRLGRLDGGLPPGWSRGFRQLRELRITSTEGSSDASSGGGGSSDAAEPPVHLPAEWASGFPRLSTLHLAGIRLAGTIPPAWHDPSAFPALTQL
jgi:hypothetical protein